MEKTTTEINKIDGLCLNRMECSPVFVGQLHENRFVLAFLFRCVCVVVALLLRTDAERREWI